MICSVSFSPQKGLDVSPVSACNGLTFIRMEFRNVKL